MALPLLIPVLIAGLKMLLIKLIGAVLVYFLYKVLLTFGATIINWALSQLSSNINLSDATIQLTGIAAWIGESLRLGQILTLFISFCVVRFIIGLVRG